MGRGKGGSRFRLSPRVRSVNGNVVRGRILKNLKVRIFLSNCWTWTSFVFLDFLFVLDNSTPSTHL